MAKINYNFETREQVIKLVLKGEKSANQIAKELGIGPNTVEILKKLQAERRDHGKLVCQWT